MTERGSALVIALLVAFILSLLGLSFMMMAQQESRIARNETVSAQALYAAEAGARTVRQWFDQPTTGMEFPLIAEVDRSLRGILDETDPLDPVDVQAADGSPTRPFYKQTSNQLFERPYRGGLEEMFLGFPGQPDIRIDDGGSVQAQAFLNQLSDTLFAAFPGVDSGLQARISRIDVYAPPYVEGAVEWNRYGIATVEVTARIYDRAGNVGNVMAERQVRFVVGEVPYHTPYGPIHSCGDLTFDGPFPAHWGTVTATGTVDPGTVLGNLDTVDQSVPRTIPAVARLDTLWAADGAAIDAFMIAADGTDVPDPWLRVLAGGEIVTAPAGNQPWPPASPPVAADPSNRMQDLPSVSCPEFDYEFWKSLALSGSPGVHYYAYDTVADDGRFREDGVGPLRTFDGFTGGENGLHFFDTEDGRPPRDDDGDGEPDNLTPAVNVNLSWTSRGLIYLNAENLNMLGGVAAGANVTFNAPGEPYLDLDGDLQYSFGDTHVNLGYPTVVLGAAVPVRNDGGFYDPAGPGISATASFHGIFFNSGAFSATGTGRFYGSVIARGGVALSPTSPDFYWDASIHGDWPPAALGLPRVYIESWRTRP